MSGYPKVAIVNTVNNSGGAAKAALTLLRAINQPVVPAQARFFHCGDKKNGVRTIGLKKTPSRYSNAVLSRFSGSMLVYDYGVARKILNETRNDDVLNVHNLHGYYLNFQKLISEWGERPVVWTWHDMWGATGRCGFSFDCDLWQSGCSSCPNKAYYPAAWIDRARVEFEQKFDFFANLKNLKIVTPSSWLSDIAINRGYPVKQITTIPYAVRTDIFKFRNKKDARKKLNIDKEQIALFVAYDCGDARKGYDDFVKAIQLADCQAIAIGKLPENPHPNVCHVGPLSDSKTMSLYYAAADVLVVPSYADNYPNTVLESLCCGTPVIGYSVGGLESLLTYEGCVAVSIGDIEQLAFSLESSLVCSITQMNSIEISKAAMERWNPVQIAQQYVDTFLI